MYMFTLAHANNANFRGDTLYEVCINSKSEFRVHFRARPEIEFHRSRRGSHGYGYGTRMRDTGGITRVAYDVPRKCIVLREGERVTRPSRDTFALRSNARKRYVGVSRISRLVNAVANTGYIQYNFTPSYVSARVHRSRADSYRLTDSYALFRYAPYVHFYCGRKQQFSKLR